MAGGARATNDRRGDQRRARRTFQAELGGEDTRRSPSGGGQCGSALRKCRERYSKSQEEPWFSSTKLELASSPAARNQQQAPETSSTVLPAPGQERRRQC
eukprot:867159-Rhodomonas_salina.1